MTSYANDNRLDFEVETDYGEEFRSMPSRSWGFNWLGLQLQRLVVTEPPQPLKWSARPMETNR